MPSSQVSLDVSTLKLMRERARAELNRRRRKSVDELLVYQDDPAGFVDNWLYGFLWSKQREIAESVQKNRLTAVPSCHGTGKSVSAAMIACWWIACHEPGEAFAVTLAPTAAQVDAILWREMNRIHSQGRLPGRMTTRMWRLDDGELVAFGRSPADTDPTAVQGIHAKYVLIVIDEACHDDQTEVMTGRGWVPWPDVRDDDTFLTKDLDTEETSLVRAAAVQRLPYRGEMIRYEAKGASFCVTPDHSMVVRGRNGREGGWYPWRRRPAAELATLKGHVYASRSVSWSGESPEFFELPGLVRDPTASGKGYYRRSWAPKTLPMSPWLAFLGWFDSEGSFTFVHGRPGGVAISQKDPGVRAEIKDLATTLGFRGSDTGQAVHISHPGLAEYLLQFGRYCYEKRAPDFIRDLSPDLIAEYVKAYARGDGYQKGERTIIYTSSPTMAADLHEFGLKLGKNAVVRERALTGLPARFKTHTATSLRDGFVVCLSSISTDIKLFPENYRRETYDGMVYCATVPPHHLLLTRRDGYAIWSGNCGVGKQIWDAASSMASNEYSRMLAIGNPDDPSTEFEAVCRPGSGWNVIPISAFDSPNFTDEPVPDFLRPLLVSQTWVDERKRRWGEDSPIYKSKVLGEFPSEAADGLVPLSTISMAVTRQLPPGPENELGVDVARYGEDYSVVYHRRGPVARRIRKFNKRSTMATVGEVVKAVQETGATVVRIDDTGVGGGVTDRLEELQNGVDRSPGGLEAREILRGVDIVAVNVGERPTVQLPGSMKDAAKRFGETERYVRLKDQLNWALRERFIAGDIDLVSVEEDREQSEDIQAQAADIKYAMTSTGQIQIESKDEIKKRGRPSPDDWDALVLCFASATKKRALRVDRDILQRSRMPVRRR